MKRVSRRTIICLIIITTIIKGSVAEDLFPYVKTSDTLFIKYRFSNVTEITLCIITETTLIEVINAEVEGKIEYLERIHNIKFKRELIAIETIPELYEKPEKYNHIHYFPIPWELSLFEKETFWAATGLIGVTETVIMSNAPRKHVTVNLDILQMDSTVQHVILTSLLTVAFILTASSVIYGNNRLTANYQFLQALTHRFVIHLWDTTSVFFAEPYPRIRNRVPDRIICLFWLLGSVVIVIFMTSYMQSDLMNESYSYIDSVYDLIEYESVQPRLLSTGISINYLRRKALKDHKIRNWLRKFDDSNFGDVYDFNNMDYFMEICEGTKAIILDKQSCWWSIGRLLWEDHKERNKMKELCQGVYLSKPNNQEYTAYLVNKSFHDNYPEFQESFDLS